VRSDYQIGKQVHRGLRSRISHATQLSTGERVVLKESTADVPSSAAVARLEREFSIAKSIRSQHVVRYLGLKQDWEHVALLEEAFGDGSLATILSSGPLDTARALHIAKQVALGLGEIHRHDVTHCAIHPGNLVVNTASWTVKIVDFALASHLEQQADPAHTLDERALPLAYISPEQTGRIERKVDHRSDFYSLGATLYHALVGHPPFELSDALALVHAHIALTPRPLSELDPRIPEHVSKLVDKLLAKSADARYQSARGIVTDLEECLWRLRSGNTHGFPLGSDDLPEKLVIPERLYGRSREQAQLLEAFDVAAEGGKVLLSIGGDPGTGKSSLIHAAREPILKRGGLFVTGKFEQLHRNAPCSALSQALAQLCRSLLGLPESELAPWRAQILGRVSTNAGLIVELAPDLEGIIGPQPKVPETGLVQAQDRFDLTLARFLSVFASADHPLTLFLDDLQWADPATLHALAALLRFSQPTHLLVITASRAAEDGLAEPLPQVLESLPESAVVVRRLQLAGLELEDVRALVTDTLRRDDSEVRELADLIAERTSCNPFFVEQLLRALYDDKLLRLAPDLRTWTWDLREVVSLGITANLAELVARKFERLPVSTRDALRLGACIGNLFELELLAATAGVSPQEMRARLGPAIRERLVLSLEPDYAPSLVDLTSTSAPLPVDCEYRFLHDRIEQAAYASIPESARPELHLRVGRIMSERTPRETRGEQVFELVEQLNQGASLITAPAEQLERARLNCEAGQRARAGTAYEEGLQYFRTGILALPRDAFAQHYPLAFALHRGYIECAYLAGHFAHAGDFLENLLPRIPSAVERAELYAIRIGFETNRGRYARAIQLGREALAALGHPIPELKTRFPLLMVKLKTALTLSRHPIERLSQHHDASDPRQIAVAKLLSQLGGAAYATDRKLFFWLVHEDMRLTIRSGLTSVSAAGCTGYSSYLIARERDYVRALAYGRLGLELARRPDAFAFRGQVHVLFAFCANGYAQNHLRTSLPILERGIELGLESGDYFFASLGASWAPEIRFLLGDPLDEVCLEAERREREIRALRSDERALMVRILRQSLRCLRGETHGRLSLTTDELREDDLQAEVEGIGTLPSKSQYALCKVMVLSWFGAYREAVQTIIAADEGIEATNGPNLRFTEYTWLASLALVGARRFARLEQVEDAMLEPRLLAGLLKPKLALLARLAKAAPVNFVHKLLLVQAELAELEGRTSAAYELYNEAIHSAAQHGYLQHEALASELAGRAFARQGNEEVARNYLRAARAGYLRWGALGKVRALDQEWPKLAPAPAPVERALLSLDAVSAVRASQALASEISLPALLDQMLRVIVQTAGAERGTLLVSDNGRSRVEAHLDLQTGELKLATEDEPLSEEGLLSQAIVRYTLRTGKDVALANAGVTGPFCSDPYVRFHHSKSILCMAVRHRDQVRGVLFLENQLAEGVFTQERLELLRLLLAQAATSLENARLFDSTQKLNAALRSSEALLRDFFEGMPVGIYVVDADGKHAFSNRRAAELFKRDVDQAVPLEDATRVYSVYAAGSDEPYPVSRTPLGRALQGERSMADDLEIRLPGRTIPLAAWGTPILGEDGRVRYALAAFQDISSQREAERVRAQLESQLHQAERLESIGRLAGGIAHDFNNLLTPILIYADLSSQALPDDSPVRRNMNQIVDAAEQAAELTKQLLAFGRQQVLKPRELDLNQELRKFELMMRRVLRENIELELHLEPALRTIRADAAQMQRVFMNLGLNAADAMPHGGRMVFATQNVWLPETVHGAAASGPTGPSVSLRVSDTGHGMDKDAMSKVFAPFFTTKDVGKGTGLGLPTVHGVVAQHGGRIELYSEPGKGTTFEILFPCIGAGASSEAPAAADAVVRPLGHGELLLVVEDNAGVRSVLAEVLGRDGYQVLSASSPAEALRIVRELDEAPRLVISDIVMPVMSGYELVGELRRRQPNLPVLLMSGYSEPASAPADLELSDIQLLPKPLNMKLLRTTVHRLLSR